MRSSRSCWPIAILVLATGAVSARQGRIDPERLLTDQFQFTSKDIAQLRAGQPTVKIKVEGEQLGLLGAIRLPGKKERLADWVRNIEHFRRSAELGTAHVIPAPPTAAAFAGVPLDADPASQSLRQALLGYTTGYLKSGNAGVSEAYAADMRLLVARATTLTALSPELIAWVERYPSAALSGADQLVYWSSMPAGSSSIVTLHHLAVYRPAPAETWIVDKSFYASRYFDAGVLVIGLYDAPDGSGFYAVAGSRMKSSQLGGAAGAVLRRQIQRSASDTVKNYLEWLRDSLAA